MCMFVLDFHFFLGEHSPTGKGYFLAEERLLYSPPTLSPTPVFPQHPLESAPCGVFLSLICIWRSELGSPQDFKEKSVNSGICVRVTFSCGWSGTGTGAREHGASSARMYWGCLGLADAEEDV